MNLVIPESCLAQHLVTLGKTGAGKSTVLRGLAENRLSLRKRVCIIDPKGDWWGLKSSRDGKSAGYPIIGIGNFKDPQATDIPIHAHAGKAVAELVATGNRPCIIGFRGWMPADMTRFWVDFASTLFNSNHGELFLFVDEVHNFAPKGRVLDVEAGKCLHWTNRLMSEGRGLGIVALIASQRPQKVHNDTLTCCETLIAMRVNHAADRDAIKAWIDGCGDKAIGQKLLDSVANMKRGEAYVWSPEAGYGPHYVKFPMFETFDSFAPPQLQGSVSQSGWSTADLDAVKERMGAIVEEAKANDPATLKARIRQLESELAKKPAAAPALAATPIEVSVMKPEHEEILRSIVSALSVLEQRRTEDCAVMSEVRSLVGDLSADLRNRVAPTPPARRVHVGRASPGPMRIPSVKASTPAEETVADGSLSSAQRKVLTVLAQNEDGCDKGKLALLAGYTYSGGFRNILSSLRTSGFIEGGNEEVMRITRAGRIALGPYAELPTGRALADYWLNSPVLGGGERAVLKVLLSINGDAMDAQSLATEAGYTYSGGFRNILSTLRTAGLITGKNTDLIRVRDELLG